MLKLSSFFYFNLLVQKIINKTLSPPPPQAMDSNSSCVLVLSGKSLAENEIAESLKSNSTLKLPDNSEVSIHLQSEIVKQESFDVELFMNSLATNRFGRLLIWSPRLPSTHDVVSQ